MHHHSKSAISIFNLFNIQHLYVYLFQGNQPISDFCFPKDTHFSKFVFVSWVPVLRVLSLIWPALLTSVVTKRRIKSTKFLFSFKKFVQITCAYLIIWSTCLYEIPKESAVSDVFSCGSYRATSANVIFQAHYSDEKAHWM